VYGVRTWCVTFLTFQSSAYPTSVTTKMPSVRNVTDAPSPDSSNVVLFEMMMHYKQEAEHLAKKAEDDKRCIDQLDFALRQEIRRADQLETELDDAIHEIRAYEVANRRGAEIIMRKHEAGMRMLDTFDTLMGAISVAHLGDHMRGVNNEDVIFVKNVAEDARTMMDIAVGQFMTGWHAPGRDIDMQADEVIDLSGETTEEDEEMEV